MTNNKININLENIKPELYQKAFTFQHLGYLITHYFLSNYRKSDFLVIYNETWCRSFIPHATVERNLKIAKELFRNKNKFEEYYSGLKNIIQKCDEYLQNIPSSKDWVPRKEDWISLQKIIDDFYYYYEKTEFFFADAGYDPENNIPAENMKLVGEFKMDARQRLNDLLINSLYKYAEKTAKQFNLNPEELKFYSYKEILDLYDTNRTVPIKIIKERQHSYVLYCVNSEIIVLDNEQKKIVIENFKESSVDKITEFKGIIASKGIVRGKVRVIIANYQNNYRDFQSKVNAMQKGEILVTETTSPEFVPAMKKAAGIITNQGGLGSHAAIVSREFRIPCIVGTSRATEILKTGDSIELDAINNKITLLTRVNHD